MVPMLSRHGPDMVLNMVTIIRYYRILFIWYLVVLQSKFEALQTGKSKDTAEIAKIGPFMVQTWSSHGLPDWFFLNICSFIQGCFIPNFRVLASILTDFSYYLLEKGRKKGRKLVSEATKM